MAGYEVTNGFRNSSALIRRKDRRIKGGQAFNDLITNLQRKIGIATHNAGPSVAVFTHIGEHPFRHGDYGSVQIRITNRLSVIWLPVPPVRGMRRVCYVMS